MGMDGGGYFKIAAEFADPVECPGVDELNWPVAAARSGAAKQAITRCETPAKLTQTTGWLFRDRSAWIPNACPMASVSPGRPFRFRFHCLILARPRDLRTTPSGHRRRSSIKHCASRFRVDVRMSAAKMSESRARYEHLHAAIVPLRLKIAQESLLQYNGMLMDVLQLLNARQLHFEARRNAIAALRDYWIARAELEAHGRRRLPTTRPASQPAAHGD